MMTAYIKGFVSGFLIVGGTVAGFYFFTTDFGIGPEFVELIVNILPQEEMNEVLKEELKDYKDKIGAKKQTLPAAPTGVLGGYAVFVVILVICLRAF